MFAKNASPKFKRYAIGIIVLGFIAMYFSCCLTNDALNVIQPAFVEKFGWTYSQISMPFTVGGYIWIVLAFVCGTFIIKKGSRGFAVFAFAASAFGALLMGISYSLSGRAAMGAFTASALILKIAVMMMQMVAFQLCACWFVTARGRILGLVTIGAPLNSATSTTLITLLMNRVSLTVIYAVIAIILAVVAVLAIFIAISTPAEVGLAPDGAGSETEVQVEALPQPRLKIKDILTKSQTWLIGVAFGFLNGIIGAVMAFFITRMDGVGVATNTALVLLTVSSLLGIPLSYLFGWIDDKIGTIKASRILAITYIVMLLCFLFGGSGRTFFLVIIAMIGTATMTGATPNLHPSSIMYLFGAREYQNANRYIGIIVALISGLGFMTMSWCLDLTGSMNTGYIIFIAEAVVALVCLFFIKGKAVEEE